MFRGWLRCGFQADFQEGFIGVGMGDSQKFGLRFFGWFQQIYINHLTENRMFFFVGLLEGANLL